MKLETLQAELNKIERRRAKLEQQLKTQADALFKSLPAKVGLKNIDALVLALLPYATPGVRAKVGARGAAPSNAPARAKRPGRPRKATAGHDKRVRYSNDKKAAVRKELEAGKLTIREVSIQHGVPIDSIKKWKRNWGLTASRKKK